MAGERTVPAAPIAFVGDTLLRADALRLAQVSAIPGCVIGRAVGESVAVAGCGYASLSPIQEITTTTPFRLSSVTKVMTTLAVLRLLQRNEVRLDDRVADVTALSIPPDVTVEHLLTHTSGLAFDGPVHVARAKRSSRSIDAGLARPRPRARHAPTPTKASRCSAGSSSTAQPSRGPIMCKKRSSTRWA